MRARLGPEFVGVVDEGTVPKFRDQPRAHQGREIVGLHQVGAAFPGLEEYLDVILDKR